MAVANKAGFFRTLILLLLLYVCSASDMRGGGGQCLSDSQYVCRHEMTRLIQAEDINYDSVCRRFGEFHSCILQSMSLCSYKATEWNLYEADIVEVYTKKPYRCNLIGGDLRFQGVYSASNTIETHTRYQLYTLSSITLLCHLLP